jgi:uncharacterized membrane protein
MVVLDGVLALAAAAPALWLRPWRGWGAASPPWPAWTLAATLPLLWSLDRIAGTPLLQPLSGVGLLVLMLGWPLAVLAVLPVVGVMALLSPLTLAEALHRGVWLGLVPATLLLLFGAALRRWLPPNPFVYTLGRAFFGTALALTAAGALAGWLDGAPPGLALEDLLLARGLAAFGDAFLTGMLAAIFVAYRPQWLATWADRLYLRD